MMQLFHTFLEARRRWRTWFLAFAENPHARVWLGGFSFVEASFFPLPPDLLLIALSLVHPSRWISYASITTVASLFGGAFGYVIGMFLYQTVGEALISAYGLEDEVRTVGVLFEENAWWAIFSAAFTPIPYKVFTISAGFFGINFLLFVLASFAGRGLRFFALSYLVKKFGERFDAYVFRYFDIGTLALAVAAVILLLMLG